AGSVGLFDISASGQGGTAIEDSDIVQTQEAALENVHAAGILAIHPPGEVQQQLVKYALEEGAVSLAVALFFDLVDAPCLPGVNGRIDIAKRPLISRDLSVG